MTTSNNENVPYIIATKSRKIFIENGITDPEIHKKYICALFFIKYICESKQTIAKNLQIKNKKILIAIKPTRETDNPITSSIFPVYDYDSENHEYDILLNEIIKTISTKTLQPITDILSKTDFTSSTLGENKERRQLISALIHTFNSFYFYKVKQSSRHDNLLAGKAFNLILEQLALISKKGHEVFPPQKISTLIHKLITPIKNDHICDPSCGTSSFLIQSTGSKSHYLFAQEATINNWVIAKMNMIINQIDNHQIEWGDAIRNPKLTQSNNQLKQFDATISVPPFTMQNWGHDAIHQDKFSRFCRGIPPRNRGNYAYILHMLKTLKPSTGRMAIVMPHSVLFRQGKEQKIRKQLITENLLDTVIGLPKKIFYGSNIPTVILLFKLNKPDQNVLFINASQHYQTGRTHNKLRKEDIEKIVTTYTERNSTSYFSHLATLEEIEKNNFNISIPLYIDKKEVVPSYDLQSINQAQKNLRQQLPKINKLINQHIIELLN